MTRPANTLTLQEAAARLGLPYSRLYRWAREGRVLALRDPGGRWFMDRDEVARLAARLGLEVAA
jgi:excisionase family DNA binding protein